MTTRRQFNAMLALCAGDRDVAARLSGFDPDAPPKVVRLVIPDEPKEIDWTDCPLAKQYGAPWAAGQHGARPSHEGRGLATQGAD